MISSALNPMPNESKGSGESPSTDFIADVKTDTQRQAKLLGWFQQEMRRQSVNRFQMAMDEDYYDSEHFTAEEKAVIRARGQAPVVYNETKSTIDWLIGTERRTRVDFTIQAREESDQAEQDAQTKTKLLKYIHDANKTEFERSAVADDVFKAGIGWLEVGISEDPEDELIYTRHQSWRTMLYDSLSERRDLQDSRYLFRFRMVDLDLAMAYFPDKHMQLKAAAVSANSQNYMEWWNGRPIEDMGYGTPMPGKYTMYDSDAWINNLRERVMLIEAWYREPTNESTGVGPAALDRVRMKMRCTIFTEKHILLDQESPYKHNKFPFIPFWCYRRKRDNAPYGIARSIRGPQDSLNKRMSKVQHILAQAQIIAENDAFDDEIMTAEEAREEYSSPNGLVLLAKNGLAKVKTDRQNDVAESHVRLMDMDAAIIRNSAGVTNENLGRDTNATSGIAVQKKTDQGSILTAEVFDNLLFGRQMEGEITLSLIEQYYNQPKEFAITGERSKREYTRINQFDPVTGQILNDITARRCNFTIGEQNWKQSLQQAAAESMMQLLQQLAPTSPEVVTALLDVAVELFDLPNKSLVLQRIRSVTGMVDPNEKMTPEQERAKAEADAKKQESDQLEIDRIKEELRNLKAKTDDLIAARVKKGVESSYAAMQAGQVIATMPTVAPIADEVMKGAGYQIEQGDDPNFPVPPVAQPQQMEFPGNTNPVMPATPGIGEMRGIETPELDGVQEAKNNL